MNTTEEQFAGALAHQLKSPTAALGAASANLRRNLRGLLEDLASMTGTTAPPGATALFISRVLEEPAPPPLMGLLPQDRIDVIARRLADAGVPCDLQSAASGLLRGGWDTYLQEIAPLLRTDTVLALDLLETAARLRTNLGGIEASLKKINGIAAALRLLGQPVEGDCFDIGPHLSATAALVKGAIPAGIHIETRFAPTPAVSGRPELLNEVWSNLLTNAAQALGACGTITIETLAGPLQKASGFAGVIVRIIDDGPGIPEEALAHIFEMRFTTRAAEGGSGLGLPLARRIVEKMGGAISVETRPGRTCFTVHLPAAVQRAAGKA